MHSLLERKGYDILKLSKKYGVVVAAAAACTVVVEINETIWTLQFLLFSW